MTSFGQRLGAATHCALALGLIAGVASGAAKGWIGGINAGVIGFVGAGLAASVIGLLVGFGSGKGPLDLMSGASPRLPHDPSISRTRKPETVEAPRSTVSLDVTAGRALVAIALVLGLIGLGYTMGNRGQSESTTALEARSLGSASLGQLEILEAELMDGSCPISQQMRSPRPDLRLLPYCDDPSGTIYWLTPIELAQMPKRQPSGSLSLKLRNGTTELIISTVQVRITTEGAGGSVSREYTARSQLEPLSVGDVHLEDVLLPAEISGWTIVLVGAQGASL